MPTLNFTLDSKRKKELYEREVKRLEKIITTSDSLEQVYSAHQDKQDLLRLLNPQKGA